MPYKRECELARVTDLGKIEKATYRGKATNDDQYNEIVSAVHNELISELNCRIKFSRNDRVLDAGCGRGGLTKRINKHVHCVIGIDLLKSSLKDFDDTTIPRVQCNVANLPFCDGCFDKIYSYSVTEYFHNTDHFRQFLTEQFRVLKSGGILYIGGIFNGYLEGEYAAVQNPSMLTKMKITLGRTYRKLLDVRKERFHQFEYLYIRPDFFLMLDEEKFEAIPLLSTIKNQTEDVLKFRYDVMIIKKNSGVSGPCE